MNPIQHALELARFGIPVFPCNHDKSPATPNGFKDATTDDRQIRRYWGPNPDRLIGTPTGIKFDVLDVDVKHPEANDWLAANDYRLPLTRAHLTRSGGLHYLYAPTPGLKNSTSKLAIGIDIKTRGGYVIWWPCTGLDVFAEHALAEMPSWIVEALKPRFPPAPEPSLRLRTNPRDPFFYIYQHRVQTEVEDILRRARDAIPGSRHNTYWQCSQDLKKIVDQGFLEMDEAFRLLFEAAQESADPGTEAKTAQALRVLR
jgi:hypothetical protein